MHTLDERRTGAEEVDVTQNAAFDDVWPDVDVIPGWLTRDQAHALWDAVRRLGPSATVVEIGSHRGRSTSILALARRDVRITAIDPFVVTRRYPGDAARRDLEEHLARLGVEDQVEILAEPSATARRSWTRDVDLLWVDGKHDAATAADDLRWARFLPQGGEVFLHDCFSSVGVTLAVLFTVLPGGRLAYRGRTGSLARFVVASPTWRDRVALLAELPWWVRNVAVKVALRARLRPLARLLGHDLTVDPY